MFHFSLSNMMLAIVPLGAGFWSARELFRGQGYFVSILLIACICTMLGGAGGALVNGRQGLQRGLLMGAAAVAFVTVGAVVCVAAVMLLIAAASMLA